MSSTAATASIRRPRSRWAHDGSYYGTTTDGGAQGYGTIFRITTNDVFIPVASFANTNGANPYGRLLASGDAFFGTTANGGTVSHGCVFQLITNTIHAQVVFTNSTTDGAHPYAGLIADTNGVLYGTTLGGGAAGAGAVFKMNVMDTSPTVLASFTVANGLNPEAGLWASPDGNFYGTTAGGGSNSVGVVFKMSSAGVVSNLFTFGTTNGANPWAVLVQGADNNLYGTTVNGGPGGYGTIFRVTTNDTVEMVAAFGYTNGANPYAELTPAADGSLYGVARFGGTGNYGTIFNLTTNGVIEALFSFNYSKGSHPFGGLTFGGDGNLYGTASEGGSGSGTAFRFVLNPPAPVFQSVTKTNGNVTLTWSTVSGGDYQLQYKTNLMQVNWNNLGFVIGATNSTIVASDVAPPNAQRFYRVLLLQP